MNRKGKYGSHFIDEARLMGVSRQQHAVEEWLRISEELLLGNSEFLVAFDGVKFDRSVVGMNFILKGSSEFYMQALRKCCNIHCAVSDLLGAVVSGSEVSEVNAAKKIGSRTMALSDLFSQPKIQRAGTVALQRSRAGGRARAQREAPAKSAQIAIYKRLIEEIRSHYPSISKSKLAEKVFYKFATSHRQELEDINQQYETRLTNLSINTLRQKYC